MKRIALLILIVIFVISSMCLTSFATDSPTNPFDDIFELDYYYNAVLWAVDEDITSGTTETTFQPASTCTRGQVVTFLWRANGQPKPSSEHNPFTDVNEANYYYNAVLWAVETGITSGTTETTFSPDQPCTRAHAITFLWRSVGKPSVAQSNAWTTRYANSYYYEAIQWADQYGMIWEPTSQFVPEAQCPRADIVLYLYYAMNPNLIPNVSNSLFWTDHIDKYFYLDLVGSYEDSYDSQDAALQVSTAEELAALSLFTNSSMFLRSFPGKYIIITEDIDLGKYQWEPICNPDSTIDNGAAFYTAGGFMGTFVGADHEIKNLTINDSHRSILGLFGSINGGVIDGLKVSGNITGYWNVGGIAGYNIAGKITNCHSNITFKSNGYCIGGIVGQNSQGSVADCSFSGKIECSKYNSGNIGGIAGWAGYCTIENCICTGNITGGQRVGGIVGRLQNNGNVLNCQCSGKISGTKHYNIFVGANDGINTVISGCTVGNSL